MSYLMLFGPGLHPIKVFWKSMPKPSFRHQPVPLACPLMIHCPGAAVTGVPTLSLQDDSALLERKPVEHAARLAVQRRGMPARQSVG